MTPTPLKPVLTPSERRVLDHIRRVMAETARPPTEREICGHFGWKSKFAATRHVRSLIRKGFLRKTPWMARGLNVVGEAAGEGKAREVPLLGRVPAGCPAEAVEDREDTLVVDAALFPEAEVFALRVKGDSMLGAGIHEGDVALVHKTPEANDGDIVVALLDGEATLKRLSRKDGGLLLKAENRKHKDVAVRPGTDFQLAGVVVGIVRRTK